MLFPRCGQLVIVLSLFLPQWAHANAPVDATPVEQYQALEASFRRLRDEFNKAYQAANTDAEREQAVKDYSRQSKQQKFPEQFRQLVQRYPNDSAALKALSWLLSYDSGGEESAAALGSLGMELLQSEQMVTICESLRYRSCPAGNNLLRSLIHKNRHRAVQGQARYSLALSLQSEAERGAGANERSAAALNEEAERLLTEIIAQFADVPDNRRTLGKAAVPQLFELQNLAIGKTVPDIEGEDIDGKSFKLSDYRGKVVLLDFWGTW